MTEYLWAIVSKKTGNVAVSYEDGTPVLSESEDEARDTLEMNCNPRYYRIEKFISEAII